MNTVQTAQEVLKLMSQGDIKRNIAATQLNEQSSRSHTVFQINISSHGAQKQLTSTLNLVDLAGSEGATKTQADGLRLREGSNINRSLLALSNVINRLSQAQKQFINYRDSKLTRILQTALSGNSSTSIICMVTQTLPAYQETLNTLHFGQKAKNVKTTVMVNELKTETPLDHAQKTIASLQEKLRLYEGKSHDQRSVVETNLHEQVKFLQQKVSEKTEELQKTEHLL